MAGGVGCARLHGLGCAVCRVAPESLVAREGLHRALRIPDGRVLRSAATWCQAVKRARVTGTVHAYIIDMQAQWHRCPPATVVVSTRREPHW